MPDITMCRNVDCSIRHKCRRYMAYPSKMLQSFFMPQAYDSLGGKGCDSYMEAKGWSDIMPKKKIVELEKKREVL